MNKELPLKFLLLVDKIINENSKDLKIEFDPHYILKIVDADSKSNFFFGVSDIESVDEENVIYECHVKPNSDTDVEEDYFNTSFENVERFITDWVRIINIYNSIKPIYDDTVLRSYEEKFADKFKIVDEDAETAPFDLDVQFYLDEYLTSTENKISVLIEDSSDETEIKELEELRTAAVEVRKNVSKLPKQAVVQSLAKFWAKAQKMGLPILKAVFMESVKELTKFLVGKGTELLG